MPPIESLRRGLYDLFYPSGTAARDILERHSRSVASLALDINSRRRLLLSPTLVEEAAMLHDIGIFLTDAPAIDCHGGCPYMMHGILGADLLRRHGLPEEIALVAERHTGSGIMPDEATAMGITDHPGRILYPCSTLEQLVCYADKFYSKTGDMQRKPLERVRASLARHGAPALERFDSLHRLFAIN